MIVCAGPVHDRPCTTVHDHRYAAGVGKRTFGTIRKLPSGRWQALHAYGGRQIAAPDTFTAKADASAWLSAEETAIRGGTWVDPTVGRMKVNDLIDAWLASDATKRASSLARDRSVMDNFVRPAIGTKQVAAVTRVDIQSLVDAWSTNHAPSSVGRMYSAMRAVFTYAEENDIRPRTPCRSIRLPKVELVERPHLAADELQRVAQALGPDHAPMMWLGVVGGLRWGEAAGLTVDNVDLATGTIHVRQQLGRDHKLGPPKSSAGRRSVSIPQWLVDDLVALLARRAPASTDAFVFTTPLGQALDYSRWRSRIWGPACATAGLPNLCFHDLRSMAATLLVTSGVDVRTAATRMGHGANVMLGIYARATAEADRRAADTVGAFYAPTAGK